MTNTITIEYSTSVYTIAGWRNVTIKAKAEIVTSKMVIVMEVLEIDGQEPEYNMSRTGAKRQQYNGLGVAKREVCKRKRLSSCTVLRSK